MAVMNFNKNNTFYYSYLKNSIQTDSEILFLSISIRLSSFDSFCMFVISLSKLSIKWDRRWSILLHSLSTCLKRLFKHLVINAPTSWEDTLSMSERNISLLSWLPSVSFSCFAWWKSLLDLTCFFTVTFFYSLLPLSLQNTVFLPA